MIKSRNIVDGIKIASPCHMSWDRMTGDNQVRFCESCELHVFNISEMDVDEAANLISTMDGRLCVRLHRRRDGTVMTRDCPVGVRMALRKTIAAVTGAFFLMVTGLAWAVGSLFRVSRGSVEVMGSIGPVPPVRLETEHTLGMVTIPYRPNSEPISVEVSKVSINKPVEQDNGSSSSMEHASGD